MKMNMSMVLLFETIRSGGAYTPPSNRFAGKKIPVDYELAQCSVRKPSASVVDIRWLVRTDVSQSAA